MAHISVDFAPSPVEGLLNSLEAASVDDLTANGDAPPIIPTLDQFLMEEEIVREVRSDNARLISYISQPSIIYKLLYKCFEVPSLVAPQEVAAGFAGSKTPSQQSPTSQSQQEARELLVKHAYVACEVLTAENKEISEALISDDAAMTQLFSCLDRSTPGSLEPLTSMHFSKIIIALLKSNNAQLIQQLTTRTSFIPNILKHMDCAAIAELIVHIIATPEPDAYDTIPSKGPTNDALNLLAETDLLGCLAQCFVRASTEFPDPEQRKPDPVVNESSENDNTSAAFETGNREDRAKRRRLREEKMANIGMTIVGLTNRLLHLPELGVPIPPKLCPFTNPSVVTRILDAGLYAYSSGRIDANGVPHAFGDPVNNEERVEAFSAGNTSALIYSLGLAADLMTTEANVFRDDSEDAGQVEQGANIKSVSIGVSREPPPISSTGTGIIAVYNAVKGEGHDRHQATSKTVRVPELADKKAGEPIVETTLLQKELSVRFPRLSEMLGCDEEDLKNNSRAPLGSLRLKLAEFFVACMKNTSDDTVDLIMDLGVPQKLLFLFSRYQWSSMLHGVVTRAIIDSLEKVELGRPSRSAWFLSGVVPWLIESWSQNYEAEDLSKQKRSRAGYMGHLIRIGTALQFYFEENRDENYAGMPEHAQVEAFFVFAREALAPAQVLEITPICEVRPDEDAEEATDLLEMTGMSFADSLGHDSEPSSISLVSQPLKPDDDIDHEDEIMPVEVDDLEQYGVIEDLSTRSRRVDHDIPPEMRARLYRKEEESVEEVKSFPEPVALIEKGSSRPSASRSDSGSGSDRSQKAYMSRLREMRDVELADVIDTVDSSSDDEGSYEAFVDTRSKPLLSNTTEKFANLRIVDNDVGSASLAGAVTEIEDEAIPITPENELMQLASNVVSVVDDTADSSDDEEYEAWNEPSRVDTSSNTQKRSQSDDIREEKINTGEASAKVA